MVQLFLHRAKINFAIRSRGERRATPFSAKKLPRPKRYAPCLKRKSKRPKIYSENSPIAKLFNDEAVACLAFETILMKTDLFVSAKKLHKSFEGFLNSPEGAPEFYDRVWNAWQNEMFACGFHFTWAEFPTMVESLRKYSNKWSPAERVAHMKEDPSFLDILKATKPTPYDDASGDDDGDDDDVYDRDKKAMMRGLLSIILVYWNDIDDFEKLFKDAYIIQDETTSKPESDFVKEDRGERDVISYLVEHDDDVQDLEKVLQSKYPGEPDVVTALVESISHIQRNSMSDDVVRKYDKRLEIEVEYYDRAYPAVFWFKKHPSQEPMLSN